MGLGLFTFGVILLVALMGRAEPLRVAIWNVEAKRAGPGLLLRDIEAGKDRQILAIVSVLNALSADVLLLTGFDYDYELRAARALSQALERPYPEIFAFAPNRGLRQGLDLWGDGRSSEAQAWGRFAGHGGMVLLSRQPLDRQAAEDFSTFRWTSLPQNIAPAGVSPQHYLASSGHWRLPVDLGGARVDLLAYHAAAPVFDGPEDRNGRRNHDETAFWLRYLAGELPYLPPQHPVILLGTANLDPLDGEGRPAAIRALLAHPQLRDLRPSAPADHHDPDHRGEAELDTAIFDPAGGLRVDILLPDRRLFVLGSGQFWAAGDSLLGRHLRAASRHRPLFVDIDPALGDLAQ